MNKYYELVADIDGIREVQFGSFVKSEVVFEKDAEKDSLKDLGYKRIRIESRYIDESPHPEVYGDTPHMKAICKALKDPKVYVNVGDMSEDYYDLEVSRDIGDIQEAITATECPIVNFRRIEVGKYDNLGNIVVIPELNDCSIADHSDNDFINNIVE